MPPAIRHTKWVIPADNDCEFTFKWMEIMHSYDTYTKKTKHTHKFLTQGPSVVSWLEKGTSPTSQWRNWQHSACLFPNPTSATGHNIFDLLTLSPWTFKVTRLYRPWAHFACASFYITELQLFLLLHRAFWRLTKYYTPIVHYILV